LALALSVALALALSGCDGQGAGSEDAGADTPQRFLQIEGDVAKYVSMKTGEPVRDDGAQPGDAGFEGEPLTEFVEQAEPSGEPQWLWLVSSGDGFTVKIAWEGADKAYIVFSEQNGWSIVAPEHPVSVNAMDLDRIIVVSEGSKVGLPITRADGSKDVVPFGAVLTSPMQAAFHYEGRADDGGLSSEVYTRELTVLLADVYDGYGGGGFEIVTEDGDRYLSNGDGRFRINRQRIDYMEVTGDVYEDVTQIRLKK
jgi:hypothetical protein